MSNAYTFYFNDIFEKYDDWKSVMSDNGIVDYNDSASALFDERCYNLLTWQFGKQNIRYSEPDAFISQLLLIYSEKFNKFKKEKEIIDKIYKLNDDELILVQELLTNMANNPNTEVSDPKKPMQYISAQTYQSTNNSKLKSFLTALNNMPSNNIFKFLNGKESDYDMSFRDLFMVVIPPIVDFYKKGSGFDEHF